ncbi:hypothetical protein E3E12_05955 [Formicincola oecophyllae]|uniref:Uncharacterized protein n=1 Tax=Formicincola oecophyllae TaxID=2558361 RepID=A0A4Y6U8M1_9PROT|nr:hypothetical protein [Formicincola oecophyllae]QDH13799.1 hypothetical protein E3E12_05955 [Formicincola oecophyllae]
MLPDILAGLSNYSGLAEIMLGCLSGWLGSAAKNRLERRRQEIDAGQLENQQFRLALLRERDLTDRTLGLTDEVDALWRRLAAREAVVGEYHTLIVQARRRIHDLEGQQGQPLTVFEALPAFPPLREMPLGSTERAPKGVTRSNPIRTEKPP